MWTLVNVGLLVGYFIHFQIDDNYFYMRQRTKVTIPSSAVCVCMLVLTTGYCHQSVVFVKEMASLRE